MRGGISLFDFAMSGCEIVVVTGFGPFRQFFVNLSWEAAQGLQLVGLGDPTVIYVKELPVSYVKAQQIIAEIWRSLRPKFVLHLGVATGSTGIILEQTGKNLGYRDRDVRGFCPESHSCVEGGPEKLDSLINMRTVCKELNQAGVDVHYSRDAGRYRGHPCCIQRHWRKYKNRKTTPWPSYRWEKL
uniref:Pyroglutamyl-peptidase I like n=1 Tax=Takifugu rubripes TaxID=31033 RepID=A0A674PLH9_TAKRU